MDRRSFIATGTSAVAAALATPALAHDQHIVPSNLPEEFQPREVRLRNRLEPYEIHVEPSQFAMYWTLPRRRAIRYTVGIGRPGLYHAGEYFVGQKRRWPSWRPTPAMIEREPNVYGQYADGVPGGPNNPLGARALYLHKPGRGDTYLRIHGTNAPGTIGRRVSNGCARLVNDQIVEFYELVPLNTRVVLYPIT